MAIILVIFIAGCSQKNNQVYIDQQEYSNATIQTFQETGDALCTDEQGKPIIRFFATSWCPHCKWIKETYMGVMKKYIDEGKVTAYLWEVDTNDDLLRKGDQPIPSSEEQIFKRYNPKGSIPTFIFGCTYYRVGNGYEQQNNLAAEAAEFHAVIREVLATSGQAEEPADEETNT